MAPINLMVEEKKEMRKMVIQRKRKRMVMPKVEMPKKKVKMLKK